MQQEKQFANPYDSVESTKRARPSGHSFEPEEEEVEKERGREGRLDGKSHDGNGRRDFVGAIVDKYFGKEGRSFSGKVAHYDSRSDLFRVVYEVILQTLIL